MGSDVNDLSRVQHLIAESLARMGSHRKLAAAIGYPFGNISDWHHGRRPCPTAAQALMAEIAGLDPAQITLYSVIQSERNPERKEHLLRVLGKTYRQLGGAALSCIIASALWAFSPAPSHAGALYDV